MKRGDVVLVAIQGDFGKVRPAIVVQADQSSFVDSVTVCLVTSELVDGMFVRVDVQPTVSNGLAKVSKIQADKVQTVRKTRIRERLGALSAVEMSLLDSALALHLDLYAPQR
ncbi:MAG: type II toxin-antitoxin system PemK/MazF family toxin [Ahrensia sp.]|nr:type II toxin-antitoxin system PemK/MazF family toxin [Ahrensia sp.]